MSDEVDLEDEGEGDARVGAGEDNNLEGFFAGLSSGDPGGVLIDVPKNDEELLNSEDDDLELEGLKVVGDGVKLIEPGARRLGVEGEDSAGTSVDEWRSLAIQHLPDEQ